MNGEELFYEDGDAEALGRAVRRKKPAAKLANHVPIRFTEASIAEVRDLAEEDGLTVSSWIRHVVDREVMRRRPVRPESRVDAILEVEFDLDPRHSTASQSSPTSDDHTRMARLA